jgi:hypothetical protein
MEGTTTGGKGGMSPATKAILINGLLVFAVVIGANLTTDWVKTKMKPKA